MDEDPREIAAQARDMARALFFGLVDEGVLSAEQAWRIFEPFTDPLPQDEVDALRSEIARALDQRGRRA